MGEFENSQAAEVDASLDLPFKKPQLRLGRGLFYMLTIIALLLIYWKFSEIEHLRALFSTAGRGWLIVVVSSQLLAYYFTALNYREVLRMKGLTVHHRELFPITFIIQFITQAVPTAGLAGQVFFIYYLRKYKLTFAEGMARAVLEVLTLYLAFSCMFVLAVLLLFQVGILEKFPLIWIFIYAFIFFFLLVLAVFIAVQKRRRIFWFHWIVDRLYGYFRQSSLPKIKKIGFFARRSAYVEKIMAEMRDSVDLDFLAEHRKTFVLATFWQAMVLLANASTLFYIGYAIRVPLPFTVAFVVFILSKLISMTSFIPGSFGIFEAGMVAVLYSFGISTGSALAVTILFRALTFWLPMPIGWFLYGRYMGKLEDTPIS